jgi:beta-glucosidase
MKKLKSLLFGLLVVAALAAQNKLPIYLDNTQPIELRIKDALSKMTTEEKVAMCHAQSKFSSPGVPRLGIPRIPLYFFTNAVRAIAHPYLGNT